MRKKSFALVTSHQFGMGYDMAFHRALQIVACGAGFQVQIGIQGIEFEEITMRASGRRTRAAVPAAAKTVATLLPELGLSVGRDAFGQLLRVAGNRVQNPVR